ncbi:MAG: DUF4835 family protein [Flavobacteriales bacterium]|nr:DUF4835 family protein [Flavobacteriales bacterium]MCB9448013.1 DUF4835 family protein [Flavobacteriales bacterium]
MIPLRKICICILTLLTINPVMAQELNCNVQVVSPQVQSSDKHIFETLQNAIYEFMNNRQWTNHAYLPEERIECNMLINITDRVSSDEFKGTLSLQVSRPVYGTSYNTVLLNYNDNNFNFRYQEYQPLQFNENTYTDNLTSLLAYYAYLMIGMDYDSFGDKGGSAYLLKAQNIVNNAQNAQDRGWKSFESTQNRYWLIENFLNPAFVPLRSTLYQYHRKGLDVMSADVNAGRSVILESIEALKQVHNQKPSSYLMQVFFNAKSEELVNIFSEADPGDRKRIVETLVRIDPGNTGKYNKILTGK